MIIMLDIGQIFRELAYMMIINQCNRTHCLLLFIPILLNKTISNQVSDRLGAVAISFSFTKRIKIIKQLLVERNRKTCCMFLHHIDRKSTRLNSSHVSISY